MKRKINKVGQNTLTVSLPSSWAKKNDLNKGDDINIFEDENSIIISKENQVPSSRKVVIDVSGQKNMIHRIIASLYKSGYDQVDINYSSPEELKQIQERIERNLTEFDIAEYKKRTVMIRPISKLDPEQFNNIYKKVFFILKDIIKDTLTALEKNDREELNNIVLRDKSIDKYTDFCRRLMNRGFESPFNKPFAAYYIIEELEIIADLYKDMNLTIVKNKLSTEKKLIILLKDVNEFLELFLDVILKFNMEKIKKIGEEKERISKKIQNMINKINKNDLNIFLFIVQIFNATFEMKSSLMVENI